MKRTHSRLLNYKFWLDMVFPNRCPCCNKIISWEKLICNSCSQLLPYLDDTPWELRFPDNVCGEKILYDYAVSAFAYASPATEGIFSIKDGHGSNFLRLSAQIICDKLENDDMCDFDCLSFVPMSRRKKLDRGYNQAQDLATLIGKRLDKPVLTRLLGRKNVSMEQHSLNAEQRSEFAKEIYYIDGKCEDISGKTVLLCDDVFTTGATMNKCTQLLKYLGADKVYCVSICYTDNNFMKNEE